MAEKTFFQNQEVMHGTAHSRDKHMFEVCHLNQTLFLWLRKNLELIQGESQWKLWMKEFSELFPKYHKEFTGKSLPETLEARVKSASAFMGKKNKKNSELRNMLRQTIDL